MQRHTRMDIAPATRTKGLRRLVAFASGSRPCANVDSRMLAHPCDRGIVADARSRLISDTVAWSQRHRYSLAGILQEDDRVKLDPLRQNRPL